MSLRTSALGLLGGGQSTEGPCCTTLEAKWSEEEGLLLLLGQGLLLLQGQGLLLLLGLGLLLLLLGQGLPLLLLWCAQDQQ